MGQLPAQETLQALHAQINRKVRCWLVHCHCVHLTFVCAEGPGHTASSAVRSEGHALAVSRAWNLASCP